jgi:hypothetical protein
MAVLIIGGGYWYILSFTDDKPMDIPVVEASADRYQAIRSRIDAFVKAVEEDKSAELSLTADEINILIAQDPHWKELKGKVHVKIKGDELMAEVSIPIKGKNARSFKGRYLNGTVGVRPRLKNGVFLVTMERVCSNVSRPPHNSPSRGKVGKSRINTAGGWRSDPFLLKSCVPSQYQ